MHVHACVRYLKSIYLPSKKTISSDSFALDVLFCKSDHKIIDDIIGIFRRDRLYRHSTSPSPPWSPLLLAQSGGTRVIRFVVDDALRGQVRSTSINRLEWDGLCRITGHVDDVHQNPCFILLLQMLSMTLFQTSSPQKIMTSGRKDTPVNQFDHSKELRCSTLFLSIGTIMSHRTFDEPPTREPKTYTVHDKGVMSYMLHRFECVLGFGTLRRRNDTSNVYRSTTSMDVSSNIPRQNRISGLFM